jgi:hypothetical protein
MVFVELPQRRLRGASAGWRLAADWKSPEPFGMDKYGEYVRNISKRSVFGPGYGKKFIRGRTLSSPFKGNAIALRFDFGLTKKPIVMNWVDEFWIATFYPLYFPEEIAEVAVGE